MFLGQFLAALLNAFVWSLLFAWIVGKRGSGIGFFSYFVMVFVLTWAGGLWLKPFGPPVLGVHWVPFAVLGFVIALFIATFTRREPPKSRKETLEMLDEIAHERTLERIARSYVNVFFWVVTAVAVVAIVLRYLRR